MIGAVSLHFMCVSGPETHENCNKQNCLNHRTLLHKDWECSPSLCRKKQRLVQFRCIFCALQALKRTKIATKLHQSMYFVT